jgi:hypothetical protein
MSANYNQVPLHPLTYVEKNYKMPADNVAVEEATGVDQATDFEKYQALGYQVADVVPCSPQAEGGRMKEFSLGVYAHLSAQYGEENVVSFAGPPTVRDPAGDQYGGEVTVFMVYIPEQAAARPSAA